MTEPQEQASPMADLVNHLFEVRRRADGQMFSNSEVGLALQRKNPGAHIAKIRSGRIKNPTRETLLVLCRFFHVAPSYFFPELQQEGVVFEPVPDAQAGREKKPA